MVLAFPIGWTVSQVILAVMFYGLFTPIGLVFRLIGRDPLQPHASARARNLLDAQADPDRPAALLPAVLIGDRHVSALLRPSTSSSDHERTTPRRPHRVREGRRRARTGESLIAEFWAFLAQNKKWWLLPIVIVHAACSAS